MATDNVWKTIPLEDYELHMQHETVGQLQVLSNLTKEYLEKLSPEIVMFLGVAGGTGLEPIDNKVTSRVFGIDINQNYLDETRKRFRHQIPNLNLVNINIATRTTEQITQANLIWAALIFEYVETDTCFEFINSNIRENGYLVVTIQENNGVNSISQTGVETVKLAGQIFKLISDSDLVAVAEKFGFYKTDFEENVLPNKKSLKTYTFVKSNEPPTWVLQ